MILCVTRLKEAVFSTKDKSLAESEEVRMSQSNETSETLESKPATTGAGGASMDETIRYTDGGSPVQRPAFRYPGTGSLVFGRYRLQRVLGRGGMGVVWLAVDTKLERTVALKFLPDIIGSDPVALKELKDETKRGLELAHPNIIRIYDFVDDDDAAAISMEFVDGKSLGELRLTKPHKVFSVEEISPWLVQIADALDYAHIQRRIVHRDLKPANIMINTESEIKLADFGISRSVSDSMTRLSLTSNGTSGTLLYMSPQQAMGERSRPTDDIYSLGASLYELLSGKPPFYSGDISMQLTGKTAPSLKDRREELEVGALDSIPVKWEVAIASCLMKDPMQRPQSAGELCERLGLTLKGATMRASSGTMRKPQASTWLKPAAPSAFSSLKKVLSLRVLKLAAVLVVALLFAVWWWGDRDGEWAVQTEPQGAFVKLGDQTQVAPASFTHLNPGRYAATVKMDGFEPHVIQFSIKPGQKLNLGMVKLARSTERVISSNVEDDNFNVKSAVLTTLAAQRPLPEPLRGYYKLDDLFLNSEYSTFTENGRHYLLYRAQQILRDYGIPLANMEGQPCAETHKAIKTYQEENKLVPTGQLDSATIYTLGITALPDKTDWTPPHEGSSDDGASDGFWQRMKRLFAF